MAQQQEVDTNVERESPYPGARAFYDKQKSSVDAKCEYGHISHWMNVKPGDRFSCPTRGCGATTIIPDQFDLPVEQAKVADIHIEKIGDVATCSISLQGYSRIDAQAFVDSLEGIVGRGNVEVLEEADNASHSAI